MKRNKTPDEGLNEQQGKYYTRPVGKTFVARDKFDNLVTLKVVADSSCTGCWYDTNSLRCGGNHRECGACSSIVRADKRSVQFVVVRGGADVR